MKFVASARVLGVWSLGLLAACEDAQKDESAAAPLQSARPAAGAIVLAGRPKLARLPPRVAALAETALALIPQEAAGQPARIGVSKIGGLPDLPAAAPWPAADGRPLAFLAQFELSEVIRHLPGAELPAEGLLSFFYDAAHKPAGYRPGDRSGFRVLYSSARPDRLRRLVAPQALEPAPFGERPLSFSTYQSYPMPGSSSVEQLELGQRESQEYLGFLDTLIAARTFPDHHLLGHPAGVESDVQYLSQLASNGVDLSEGLEDDDQRAAALEKGSADWRLLLKLDTDGKAGMAWGDAGTLHFLIRRQDLRAKNFGAVWVILDSE